MGQVGFVGATGSTGPEARVTHNWSLRLNTECTPIERHAVLYYIEQGLMPKTGKRYEWEVARVRSGVPLMATIQDYDWADEVLHAADRPPVVHPPGRPLEGGDRLRRQMLVEDH